MNKHLLPTESERAAIAELMAWRGRILVVGIVPIIVFALWQLFLEEFLEDKPWLFAGLVTAVFASMLGMIVYVSFFLRCPRCSTWTGIAVRKCASCGLRYDAAESSGHGAR